MLSSGFELSAAVVRLGPVHEDRIADEPKLPVRPGDFDTQPMAVSITGPKLRDRFVGCIDAHIGIGSDVMAILYPAHPSARGAAHMRLEPYLIAPRRFERIFPLL